MITRCRNKVSCLYIYNKVNCVLDMMRKVFMIIPLTSGYSLHKKQLVCFHQIPFIVCNRKNVNTAASFSEYITRSNNKLASDASYILVLHNFGLSRFFWSIMFLSKCQEFVLRTN